MPDQGGVLGGFLGIIVIVVGFVAAVLWFLLPFYVSSIKQDAKALLEEAKVANKLLAEIAANTSRRDDQE